MSEPASPPDRPTWRDRWLGWRNRRLADSAFQRFSWANPLTRPIARQRSRQLFDLVSGFVYSQVLYACVKLKLLELLQPGPLDAATVAGKIDWPVPEAERLLKAAASLQLLERFSGERYGLGIHGAALLGNAWITRFIEHHDILYADLVDPLPLLRGDVAETGLQRYWAYARSAAPGELAADATADYSALMAGSQRAVSAEVLNAYDFGKHRRLIDVGGGKGAFLEAVAERHPNLELVLFDLPGVVAQAERNPRIRPVGGSFFTDPLPEGADVVTLVRIVHDHDDEPVVRLLSAIKRALPPGGVLVVAEPLAGTRGAEPVTDAYFNIYFAAMRSGRTRSGAAIGALGKQAGFGRFHIVQTRNPLLADLVLLHD